MRGLKDLPIIIKHFEEYPLLTQKRADFELFKESIQLMLNKSHFTVEGLKKIISLKMSMNKGLSSSLQAAFPGIDPTPRPLVLNQRIEDPSWVSGFTDAEGCFLINLHKSPGHKLKERVTLRFVITQHARDTQLLELLAAYLGCGFVKSNIDTTKIFVVYRAADINDKVIPFFDKYPLVGAKFKDYYGFRKAVNLIEDKAHLTPEGLNEIRSIKAGMNSANLTLPEEDSSEDS